MLISITPFVLFLFLKVEAEWTRVLLCDRLNTHTHMEKAFTSVPISLASSDNTVPCLNLRAVPSVLPMPASLVHLLSGMTSCRVCILTCHSVPHIPVPFTQCSIASGFCGEESRYEMM